MSFVVVDTDVASFCFKGDSRAQDYRRHLEGNTLVLSFMSVAEFRYWVRLRNWGATRRAELESFLEKFVIHPYDDALCTAWADVTYQARRKGRQLQCADGWIAGIALLHDVPLVTHNARDFDYLDNLKLISEA